MLNIYSQADLAAYQFQQNVETWCNSRPEDCGSAPAPPSGIDPPGGAATVADGGSGTVSGGLGLSGALGLARAAGTVAGELAVPVALGALGLFVAPCDTQYCTAALGPPVYNATDNNGKPLPNGARKRRGQAGYVTRDGTIYVPVGVGGRGSNHGETGHEFSQSGKKYRNVTVDEQGNIVPVPGPAGEWQSPH